MNSFLLDLTPRRVKKQFVYIQQKLAPFYISNDLLNFISLYSIQFWIVHGTCKRNYCYFSEASPSCLFCASFNMECDLSHILVRSFIITTEFDGRFRINISFTRLFYLWFTSFMITSHFFYQIFITKLR